MGTSAARSVINPRKKTTLIRESPFRKSELNRLVDALLGHFSALGSTLTRFEAWVRFIDDVKGSLTFDHLAVCVAAFGGGERRKDFHKNRRFVRARRLIVTDLM